MEETFEGRWFVYPSLLAVANGLRAARAGA